MIKMSAADDARKTRKLVIQLLTGGVFGGVAGFAGMSLIDPSELAGDQIILAGVGLIYLLMGLLVGIGIASPKLGSKVLNLQDAEEIIEQRRILTGSTISMIALGAALMALSFAKTGGAVTPAVGLGGIFAALLLFVVISVRDWKYYDEMLLQLSRDAGNLAFCGIGTILLVWGSAAATGFATAPTALGLVSLVAGGFLLAIFVATARAGLMMPR